MVSIEERKRLREKRRREKKEQLNLNVDKSKQTIKDIQTIRDPSKIPIEDRPTDKFGKPLTDKELSANLKEQFPDQRAGSRENPIQPQSLNQGQSGALLLNEQTGEFATARGGQIVHRQGTRAGELTPEQKANTQTPRSKFFSGESGVPLTVEEGEQLKKFANATPQQLETFKEQGVISQEVINRLTEQRTKAEEEEENLMESFPEKRTFDLPEKKGFSKLPILGGFITAGGRAILSALKKKQDTKGGTILENYDLKKGAIPEPEILMNDALTQIEKEVIGEGLTASEQTGLVVEGIPIAGALIGKYAGGLVETPRGNIEAIRKNIKKERTRMTKYETWTSGGIMSPRLAEQELEIAQQDAQRMESRLKLLINHSPSLQFNSDEINVIETEMFTYKELLFAIEQRIAQVESGAITPSDFQAGLALASYGERITELEG